MSGGALARPGQRASNVMAEVSSSLEKNRKTIAALLPAEITPERLKALTLTSIRKTPKLLTCDPKSILSCVYEAAKLGLQPDTASADCHIIPRKGQATFQIGYRGMMKLARRAAPMVPIKAEHVRAGDRFVWKEGLSPVLEHERAHAGGRGDITHAYAIATLPGGQVMFKVVDAEDIARAKKTAHIYAGSPWNTHEGSMWEKTAIKRLCKTLPIDDPGAGDRLHRAIHLDDAIVDGAPQGLSLEADLEFAEEEIGFDDASAGVVDAMAHTWQCDVCGTTDPTKHVEKCPAIMPPNES